MIVLVDYATPSHFDSTSDATNVSVATNLRRQVRFHGTVRAHGFILRVALRALGQLIWSDDTWLGESAILDPVITVHPDRVFFEAFSQDQSAYGALIVDPKLFDTIGDVVTGTTNRNPLLTWSKSPTSASVFWIRRSMSKSSGTTLKMVR